MNISERLIDYRKRIGLNQSEMARRLGMLPQQYMKYEKDLSEPSAKVLKKLAELGCDIVWLLTGAASKKEVEVQKPEAKEPDLGLVEENRQLKEENLRLKIENGGLKMVIEKLEDIIDNFIKNRPNEIKRNKIFAITYRTSYIISVGRGQANKKPKPGGGMAIISDLEEGCFVQGSAGYAQVKIC